MQQFLRFIAEARESREDCGFSTFLGRWTGFANSFSTQICDNLSIVGPPRNIPRKKPRFLRIYSVNSQGFCLWTPLLTRKFGKVLIISGVFWNFLVKILEFRVFSVNCGDFLAFELGNRDFVELNIEKFIEFLGKLGLLSRFRRWSLDLPGFWGYPPCESG